MSCSLLRMFMIGMLLTGRALLQTPDHYVEVYREGLPFIF